MLHPIRSVFQVLSLYFVLCSSAPQSAYSQDDSGESTTTLVQFAQDVWPILESKCLECHGPDDAKNDYRVDEEENMLGYVEAGDVENSSLWGDYLITDDEDLHMPPLSKPQLTGAELATLKVWIEEGAEWQTPPVQVAEDGDAVVPETSEAAIPDSDTEKYWILGGLFHPAMIHFPIALLAVSSGFALLSLIRRESFEPVAFHCLWIGALGAIVACITGWSYATYEGYSDAAFGLGKAIDRHRWLGISVAIGSIVLFFIARAAKKSDHKRPRLIWAIGSLMIMLAVSTTGYQGGELTYGEDHYMKEYERLFPESGQKALEPNAEEASENEAEQEQQEPANTEASDTPTESEGASADPAEAGDSTPDPVKPRNNRMDSKAKWKILNSLRLSA